MGDNAWTVSEDDRFDPKPTEKQLDYIGVLCDRLNMEPPDVTTRSEASDLIEELKFELGWS